MRVHLLEFILGKSIMLRVTLREQVKVELRVEVVEFKLGNSMLLKVALREQLKVKLRVEVVEFKLVLFNTKRMTSHKSNVQIKTIR